MTDTALNYYLGSQHIHYTIPTAGLMPLYFCRNYEVNLFVLIIVNRIVRDDIQ